MESFIGLMGQYTKASLQIIVYTEMVYTLEMTAEAMKETGWITRCMEMESLSGQMAAFMKATT